MSKRSIFSLEFDEAKDVFDKPYRAKQLFNWLYVKYEDDFSKMSTFNKELREMLENNFMAKSIEIVNYEVSKKDGTTKYLFQTTDGLYFESVLIPHNDKFTICVSSQVGCKMGCKFCFTSKGGFKRDLKEHEIVEQILYIKKRNSIPHNISVNIVYMGMGEPLDNIKNLSKAIKILKSEDGLSISGNRQTISTSGLVEKIDLLATLDLNTNLAISLHASDDETRNKIMPINRLHNIDELLESIRRFPVKKRKKIMFEYLMIEGINDTIDDAKRLIKLMHGIKAKINLISFNAHEGSEFKKPSKESVLAFRDYLASKNFVCTIRESKGDDISAACGQLKEKVMDQVK